MGCHEQLVRPSPHKGTVRPEADDEEEGNEEQYLDGEDFDGIPERQPVVFGDDPFPACRDELGDFDDLGVFQDFGSIDFEPFFQFGFRARELIEIALGSGRRSRIYDEVRILSGDFFEEFGVVVVAKRIGSVFVVSQVGHDAGAGPVELLELGIAVGIGEEHPDIGTFERAVIG